MSGSAGETHTLSLRCAQRHGKYFSAIMTSTCTVSQTPAFEQAAGGEHVGGRRAREGCEAAGETAWPQACVVEVGTLLAKRDRREHEVRGCGE